jgi:hypothetical protein
VGAQRLGRLAHGPAPAEVVLASKPGPARRAGPAGRSFGERPLGPAAAPATAATAPDRPAAVGAARGQVGAARTEVSAARPAELAPAGACAPAPAHRSPAPGGAFAQGSASAQGGVPGRGTAVGAGSARREQRRGARGPGPVLVAPDPAPEVTGPAMDLTPGQRKAVFAGIVLALVALGAFLLVPALRSKGGAQGRPAAATQPLHTASPTPPPATPAGLGSTPPAGTGANIYTWLPFSQAGLTAAANVVRQFAADYSTYTYTESAATFVRRMRGLITAQLAGTLAQAYSTPGVAQERTQQKQVYSGTGQITSIRGFGSGAITFVVAVAQKITDTRGTSRNTINYAVTVTGAGTSWQVNDVELASAGNT